MNAQPDQLTDLIRESGQDWLLDWWEASRAGARLRQTLDQVYAAYAKRFPAAQHFGRFDDDALFDERRRNPHKVSAFLQALGAASSPDMLVMVWRILQGDKIKTVELQYAYEQSFRMKIELEDSLSGDPTFYESSDINDAALLRHWGIMKDTGRPIFEGFDPLLT